MIGKSNIKALNVVARFRKRAAVAGTCEVELLCDVLAASSQVSSGTPLLNHACDTISTKCIQLEMIEWLRTSIKSLVHSVAFCKASKENSNRWPAATITESTRPGQLFGDVPLWNGLLFIVGW